MKNKIKTVKELRDFLSILIIKSDCGNEKIKFLLKEEEGVEWLKLNSTCRDGLLKETILEFKIKKDINIDIKKGEVYNLGEVKMKKFKLCYIDGMFAYFTTQSLEKQTGDDWNDAPYEHNAGTPYEPCVYKYADGTTKNSEKDFTDGKPNWEIKKVCFLGFDNINSPCDIWEDGASMCICVDDINAKKVPWLQNSKYEDKRIKIWAGCSIEEFKKKVRKAGGKIYVEEEGENE